MDMFTATRAVTWIEEGNSQRSVALRLGVSRRAVQNVWNRYQETGSIARRRGSGRSRATTAQEDRYIRLCARRERFVTARTLQNRLQRTTGTLVSDQTIRNRLHEDGQRSRRRVVRAKLTSAQRAARLRFARERLQWGMREWGTVLFTDECKVKFFCDDRRIKVWRKKNERFSEACIHESDRWGGPNVMIWGGISLTGKTELAILNEGTVTAQRYINDVIRPHVMPFSHRVGADFTLMHDNARPHTAGTTAAVLAAAQINVLPWPANSPDLNPIEHLWDQLKRRVRETQDNIHSQRQLIDALVRCWEEIPQENIQHLVESMPSRLRECLTNRGGHTRY